MKKLLGKGGSNIGMRPTMLLPIEGIQGELRWDTSKLYIKRARTCANGLSRTGLKNLKVFGLIQIFLITLKYLHDLSVIANENWTFKLPLRG